MTHNHTHWLSPEEPTRWASNYDNTWIFYNWVGPRSSIHTPPPQSNFKKENERKEKGLCRVTPKPTQLFGDFEITYPFNFSWHPTSISKSPINSYVSIWPLIDRWIIHSCNLLFNESNILLTSYGCLFVMLEKWVMDLTFHGTNPHPSSSSWPLPPILQYGLLQTIKYIE